VIARSSRLPATLLASMLQRTSDPMYDGPPRFRADRRNVARDKHAQVR